MTDGLRRGLRSATVSPRRFKKKLLEHFREVERENAILKGTGDHDFLSLRNDRDPGVLTSAGDLFNRDSPAWRNVSLIVDAPNGPAVRRVG